MTGKPMMFICIAVLVSGIACGPQYAAKPGTAETPDVADERGKERDISMDDLPQPVQEALLAEAGEYRISEIEEVRFSDRTEYEAEWRVDGEEVEMTFAADGSIVGKTVGDDDIDHRDGDSDDDEERADTR